METRKTETGQTHNQPLPHGREHQDARLRQGHEKNVDKLTVVDGKDNDPPEIEEIKDLEDLLGVQQANPFRTTNEATLTERMGEMNLSDLQAFAIRVGILPSGNRLALKNKIHKAFKSHAGAGAGYNVGYQRPLVDPSSDAAQEILKISRENF